MSTWDDQCPKRGPALSHAHASNCESGHNPPHGARQCCHCEATIGELSAPMVADRGPVPVEPRAVTRTPSITGGLLDPEDKNKLWFYVNFCRPNALVPEEIEPMGEYAPLFSKGT